MIGMQKHDFRKRLWRALVKTGMALAMTVAVLAVILVVLALYFGHPHPSIDRPLMPTPVLYLAGVDPFTGLPADRRDRQMQLFYATDRGMGADTPSGYGQTPSDVLSLGTCDLEIVSDETSWKKLRDATLSASREQYIGLRLDRVNPMAEVDLSPKADPPSEEALAPFLKSLNASINQHRDKTLNIFVHGAVMPFADAMTMASDYHHFCGRSATWLSFAWPAHLYVYQYALGEDSQRIVHSAYHLARLLELLGEHCDARKINIICWSAGGRLVGDALLQLHELNPGKTPQQIRAETKIGHIIFCSSDESFQGFTAKMKRYHEIPEAITYTLTDEDFVLELSALVNEESQRVGHADSDDLRALSDLLQTMPNVAVLDVSYAKRQRGFDITGHRLWINQPWVSSDIILNLLSDWTPKQRGLDPTPHPNIWSMTEAYPGRVQAVAEQYFTKTQ